MLRFQDILREYQCVYFGVASVEDPTITRPGRIPKEGKKKEKKRKKKGTATDTN
jgi:hypothetical protein